MIISCQDCGEDMGPNERRRRCSNCGMLLCGWCYNHCHMLALAASDDECAWND